MTVLMGKSDFAKRRGVAPSAVSNWIKRQLIVTTTDARGREVVDVARSEALLAGMVDPSRGRPTKAALAGEMPVKGEAPMAPVPEIVGRNLASAKADLADEQLVGQRLKNAREAGTLVALAEHSRRLAEVGRLTRERIKSELRGEAERIAAESEPRAIMMLLDELVDQVFADLASLVEGGGLLEDDSDEGDLPEAE